MPEKSFYTQTMTSEQSRYKPMNKNVGNKFVRPTSYLSSTDHSTIQNPRYLNESQAMDITMSYAQSSQQLNLSDLGKNSIAGQRANFMTTQKYFTNQNHLPQFGDITLNEDDLIQQKRQIAHWYPAGGAIPLTEPSSPPLPPSRFKLGMYKLNQAYEAYEAPRATRASKDLIIKRRISTEKGPRRPFN